MIQKVINIAILLLATASIAGCRPHVSEYEEEAKARAVSAAQALIATDHNDTILMERMILDAKAIQSEYILAGDTVAAQVFDTAFKEYMLANDGDLAKDMF